MAGAAALALAGPTAARAALRPEARLAKCISLAGPAPLVQPGHPNDFLRWGNREYIRDFSRTGWVKLWVSWRDLVTSGPLGKHRGLPYLDRQVAAANADGVGVILGVYQSFPGSLDPLTVPADLTPAGDWAAFIAELCRRYTPRTGTPAIDALEPINEPNYLFRPRSLALLAAVAMIRTSAEVAAGHGVPLLLAPATADRPNWHEFSAGVLEGLAGWSPPLPVEWSHHNYVDVRERRPAPATRVARLIRLLQGSGLERRVWLTEGGYNVHPRQRDPRELERQADLIEHSLGEMAKLPEVRLWTQHSINDIAANDYRSGLRGDFIPRIGPGPQRPAYRTWARL